MSAVSLRLPDDVSSRLQHLAEATGRSKTFYMIEAIRDRLDDLEDPRHLCAPQVAPHVIGMHVGGQDASHAKAQGTGDGEQIQGAPGGVHQEGIAGDRVGDEVAQVGHLQSAHDALGDVTAGEELAEDEIGHETSLSKRERLVSQNEGSRRPWRITGPRKWNDYSAIPTPWLTFQEVATAT